MEMLDSCIPAAMLEDIRDEDVWDWSTAPKREFHLEEYPGEDEEEEDENQA